ncbi:hypothetical protein MPTK1_3g20200 [Marchantia polymorpha subsp. ruderalis]|uniref:Uncharacterized protein n=2 Tax=Marchantia polymorpha TaxID=3197 RepID=A0AAF6B2U8_MARPO|nr:hypothetical protein MARPO_0049s0013 [Marchantia polymorpha]BBN06332.1 hypothetical protein Mp_3g20200 [Marchantia polymorpha subsp. ruderalis]|eukprot:PTQ38709.1 hypothetical protein MARPO_0049s0013 [Marchantia polymorpha]
MQGSANGAAQGRSLRERPVGSECDSWRASTSAHAATVGKCGGMSHSSMGILFFTAQTMALTAQSWRCGEDAGNADKERENRMARTFICLLQLLQLCYLL